MHAHTLDECSSCAIYTLPTKKRSGTVWKVHNYIWHVIDYRTVRLLLLDALVGVSKMSPTRLHPQLGLLVTTSSGWLDLRIWKPFTSHGNFLDGTILHEGAGKCTSLCIYMNGSKHRIPNWMIWTCHLGVCIQSSQVLKMARSEMLSSTKWGKGS